MKMVKVKVSELTGEALDWAAAKAAGVKVKKAEDSDVFLLDNGLKDFGGIGRNYSPSVDWGQGGVLVDRFNIEVRKFMRGWVANPLNGYGAHGHGDTPLVAICRAVVTECLDEEVEIPAVLVKDGQ